MNQQTAIKARMTMLEDIAFRISDYAKNSVDLAYLRGLSITLDTTVRQLRIAVDRACDAPPVLQRASDRTLMETVTLPSDAPIETGDIESTLSFNEYLAKTRPASAPAPREETVHG